MIRLDRDVYGLVAQSGHRSRARAVSFERQHFGGWILDQGVLTRTCHSISTLFKNSRFSAGVKWHSVLTSLRCRARRAPGETVNNASYVIQP